MPPSEPRLPNRFDIERLVERSQLPAAARVILWALARRMDQGSTWIPPQHSPSLNHLADVTGWSKRHLQRALNYLEDLGLVMRHRPTPYEARVLHKRTAYTVNFDQLEAFIKLGTTSPDAWDSWAYGVGTPRRGARARKSRGLGTGGPGARDAVSPIQISPDQPDQSVPMTSLVRNLLYVRTSQSVSEDQAAEIRAVILARPGAQGLSPAAYIRRVLSADKHPERWLQQQPLLPEETEES